MEGYVPGNVERYILIVDDVAFMRRLLAVMLKAIGYSIREVDSVEAAIKQIRAAYPSLILLDLGMPRAGGIELIKWLQQGSVTKTIPVIVCSAQGRKSDIEGAVRAGARDFLIKPVSRTTLETRVRRQLELAATQSAPQA